MAIELKFVMAGYNDMSMSVHIGKTCSKALYGLYKIRQIRKFLSPESTKTLIHAFVTSYLDYCNSLLFGIPKYQTDRLQKVLNAAARLILRIPKFDQGGIHEENSTHVN